MKQFIFKSKINYINAFLIISFYFIGCMFVFLFENQILRNGLIVLLSFLLYVTLSRYLNYFLFYQDHLVIVYFLKIKKRVKITDYKEIKLIHYTHMGGEGGRPYIVLQIREENISRFIKPHNSFIMNSFLKRKEILEFLATKNIPIQIQSDFDEDKTILKGYAKIIEKPIYRVDRSGR